VHARPALIITADDYGYAAAYDRGILEVAGAGAIDAASAMVLRQGLEPEPLLATGVEIGLHLELDVESDGGHGTGEDDRVLGELRRQLERFEELFGQGPAHLDGHHHCHARPGVAVAIAREAGRLHLPVRSIHAQHRARLRRHGAPTPDRLVGRFSEEAEAALPEELRPATEGEGPLPPGVTEWMVHPGHSDPGSGSGYDVAREEDLDLLLGLGLDPALSAARLTHAAALARGRLG
jgi:predicted glycoside hydrolase/deacetylase ChbG (UPF0249 family)